MKHFHTNNPDFLSDTDSSFGGFSDDPSNLDPAYSNQFAAYAPWSTISGQFETGASNGGTHYGTSVSTGSTGGSGTTGVTSISSLGGFSDDPSNLDAVYSNQLSAATAVINAAIAGPSLEPSVSTRSTGGSGTTGVTPMAVGTSGSGFVINVIWDSSVQSAPSGFTAGVMDAVHYLESQFSNPVTINIDVGWGEMGGYTMPSDDLGESGWTLNSYSYSQFVNALEAEPTNAAKASAIANLPASVPDGGVLLTPAQAKALGLAAANGSEIDGYVGVSSSYQYTYDDTNGVAAGTFDLKGVVLHEITEVMGRDLFPEAAEPTALDLFHYSSPGVLDSAVDFGYPTPGYFSINGGKTSLAAFNGNPNGDPGDWASSVTDDSADAFSAAGVVNNFSSADVTAMNVIGWNPYQPSAPTGVTYTAATGALSELQSATGLNPNLALVNLAEAGGATGDTYSYTLGGPSAASFALTNVSGVEKLVAAGTGVAGAVNGKLFSLTVSATDTSGAGSSSSPADPLDIIVGSSGSDTIQVNSLASGSTPTFIYGLGGGDTINGSGMTSNLWFASGPGGDVMTGGSGANRYMYSAVGDSTASSMDLITNFHVGSDLIDLSGISTALNDEGSLSGTTINAQSAGWQASGGNTFVYVNTGSASTSLGTANMEIELHGAIALTSKNFVL